MLLGQAAPPEPGDLVIHHVRLVKPWIPHRVALHEDHEDQELILQFTGEFPKHIIGGGRGGGA